VFVFLTKFFSALAGSASRALNPSQGMALVGPQALALILDFEGLDQPAKWPGESSGITLGHGFDLGYSTAAEFTAAWQCHLPAPDMGRLRGVLGLRGQAARAAAPSLRGITYISPAMAGEVFARCSLPKFQRLALATFPGMEALTPDQQGVLVSLVFNRGGSLDKADPRRLEMREIAQVLRATAPLPEKVKYIAGRILLMRRLWPDTVGLRRRRLAEARLLCPGIPA
jgi:GH24 family phage-related lysozyme (muramidase)